MIEISGASGVPVNAVLEASLSGTLSVLAGLAFFVGLILFGIATMRAGVFPRWAGLIFDAAMLAARQGSDLPG